MPRGGEFSDGPTVQSDNPIDSTEDKIAGAPKGGSDVRPMTNASTSITDESDFSGALVLWRRPLQQSRPSPLRHQ